MSLLLLGEPIPFMAFMPDGTACQVDIVDPNGNIYLANQPVVGGNYTGVWRYTLPAPAMLGQWTAVFKAGANTRYDTWYVGLRWIERGTARITIPQPPASQIVLYYGMAYLRLLGTHIERVDTENVWPVANLTGVKPLLRVPGLLSVEGEMTIPTGNTKKATFELTSTQTTFAPGVYRYYHIGVWPDTNQVLLEQGELVMKATE